MVSLFQVHHSVYRSPPVNIMETKSVVAIGRYLTVEVRDYGNQDMKVVIVKRYYERGALQKKEFLLSVRQFQQFMWQTQDIEDAVKQHKEGKEVHYMYHLGYNKYVQVNSGFSVVDVRDFWTPEGQLQPTRRGIALKFDEYATLVMVREEILDKAYPDYWL